jgi:putative transposase
LWVAIEPINKQILQVNISFERTMLVAERFIASLINTYDKHSVSTDGGTWYPQAYRFLRLKYHLHSSLEKSITERTMQYISIKLKDLMIIFLAEKRNVNKNT